MPNSIRSLTLAVALFISVVPSISAENTGTDPKPRSKHVAQLSVLELLQSYILSLFHL
jgi:hypothetical protein